MASARPQARKKLSVVIPAYNKVGTILGVIRRAQAADIGDLDSEVIVVDDASVDATYECLLKATGIKAIRHEHNKGKGGAVKTGIVAATGDIVSAAFVDGDLDDRARCYLRA